MPKGGLIVSQISPAQLSPLEVRQIQVTLHQQYDKVDVAKVIAEAATGGAQIWRIAGDATGIVVTQILDKGNFNELFVWVMVGERILPNLARLLKVLEHVASDFNCQFVHALASQRLADVYVGRYGFQTDAVSVYRRVNNGRN